MADHIIKLSGDIKKDLENYLEEAAEWLLNYEYRKKQFYKELGLVGGQTFRTEIFVKTGPGDVVIQEVVRNSQLDYTECWLIAVEVVTESLTDDKQTFLKLRRGAQKQALQKGVRGRPAWRSYIQNNYPGELSDNKITEWWAEIIELMRLVALMRGCYKK